MTTATSDPKQGGAYRWYVVFILMMVYAMNQLDRSVVNILGQSIKEDLKISDAQLGMISGFSFAIFYATLGLPAARLADRWHRVRLISIAIALWSAMTAVCGLAGNFLQLFLARMGVGVGEAGGTPPSQSIIADLFEPKVRSTAIAVFNSALAIGTFLGFLIGGYVNEWWGWRAAFFVAGAPGLLLAAILFLTVREPIRGLSDNLQAKSQHVPPLGETLKLMFGRKSYFLLVSGATCSIAIIFVAGPWLPPLFIRLHGFESHQIGGWMALATGVGGGLGSFGGGFLADKLKSRWARAEVWVPAFAALLTLPFFLVAVLAKDTNVALAGMFGLFTLGYVWIGSTSSLIHRVLPVRTRALGIGFMLFFSNITALAFGPPLIGLLSDLLAPTHGQESLRYALASGGVLLVVSCILYLRAAKYIQGDIATNEAGEH